MRRRVSALAAILALGPALALAEPFAPVTHSFETRFGVAYTHNHDNRRSRMEPLYGARYTVTFNHQTDSGMRFGLSFGVSLDNMNTPAPWRDRTVARN